MNENEFWLRHDNAAPKFRAWNRDAKKFETKYVSMEYIPIADVWNFDDSSLVIQLFTGCRDVTGKEIYEGDVLKTDENDWIAVVVFGSGIFCLEDKDGGYSAYPNWKRCKVIGNVYENPELVE